MVNYNKRFIIISRQINNSLGNGQNIVKGVSGFDYLVGGLPLIERFARRFTLRRNLPSSFLEMLNLFKDCVIFLHSSSFGRDL